jgi:hypothetical protein
VYREIRIVKTYACRKAISNSRNRIAVTIIQGKTARTIIAEPVAISAQENPIKILSNACPESMFAKRRMLRLNTRAMYDTASMKIKKGAIARGAPAGRKRSITFQPCLTTANWLIARKCVKATKKVTMKELVMVNEYGTIPTRFAISKVKKR